MLQKGGLAWQGGFLGGALAGVWFARRKKLSLRPVMDLVGPLYCFGSIHRPHRLFF